MGWEIGGVGGLVGWGGRLGRGVSVERLREGVLRC